MTIAPAPQFEERTNYTYQRVMGPNVAGTKGPLRFEEGIATDTDVPTDFQRGAYFDTSSGVRPNINQPDMVYKHAGETMKERSHPGSASWIEAPSVLQEIVQGAFSGYGENQYERAFNPGTRIQRQQPTVVND